MLGHGFTRIEDNNFGFIRFDPRKSVASIFCPLQDFSRITDATCHALSIQILQ
jgi:hypothetical protein